MALFGLGRAMRLRTIVTLSNKQFMANMNAMDARSQRFVTNFRRMSAGFAVAGAAIGLVLGKAVKEAAGFEQALANMNSVARVSEGEFKKLRGLALQMGRTTRVGATTAANAMYELASAGQRTAQIMQTLPGIIQLSTATQYGLSETTKTVVSTLNAFGYETDQTERLTNVFAATIGKTLAKMEKLDASLAMLGPTARDAGLEIEEVSAALGILYNAGLDGSRAGTSFRRVLAALLNPSESLQFRIARLGLTMDDLDPRVHSLADIMVTLKDSGMDARAAFQDFGLRGAAALLSLMNAGDDLIELERNITGTRDAAIMAEMQLNTLSGAMDQLKNTTQALLIEWGESMIPMMHSLTDGMRSFTEAMGDADPHMVRFGTDTAMTVGGLALFLAFIGQIAMVLGTAVAAMTAWVGVAIAAAAVAFNFLSKKSASFYDEFLTKLKENDRKAAKLAANSVAQYDIIRGSMFGLVGALLTLRDMKFRDAEVLEFFHQLAIEADESCGAAEDLQNTFRFWQGPVFDPSKVLPKRKARDYGLGLGTYTPEMPMAGLRGALMPPEEGTLAWAEYRTMMMENLLAMQEGLTANVDFFETEWARMDAAFERVGQQMMAVAQHMGQVFVAQLQAGKSFLKAMGTALMQGLVKMTKMIVDAAIQSILIEKVRTLGMLTISGFFNWGNWAKIAPAMAAAAAATAALSGMANVRFHSGGAPWGMNEEAPVIIRPRREAVVDLFKAQRGGYGSSMVPALAGGVGNVDISITIQRAEMNVDTDLPELGRELGREFLDAIGRG